MKSLFIALLTLFGTQLYSQNLSFSSGLETTVAGTELHLSSGYNTKKNWGMGAFHQSKLANKSLESGNTKPNDDWYGLYINAPIANTKKINVFFQIRTGINENKFIVVVPSIETNLNLTKIISLSFGSSFRYSYPAFSFKTNIRPFNSHKK